MTIYITADRKRVVPAGHKDAAYGVAESDIDRLGLREAYDAFMAPPAAKQVPPPENKMAPPPENKARSQRRRKAAD